MACDIVRAEPECRGAPLVDQPLAFRANRPQRSIAWLEATYPMPRVTRSLLEWMRAHHQDIASLSGLEIELELEAVRHRLRFETHPRHIAWLHERVEEIEGWLRRWMGHEAPIPFPQPESLGGCGLRKSPAPSRAADSGTSTAVIPVRGRGRGH
jgi:hypothetical protein